MKHIFTFSGELNESTSQSWLLKLNIFIASKKPDILVIDMNNVTCIDNYGVNLLLTLNRRIRNRKSYLEIINASTYIKRMLSLVGLNNVLR